MIPAPFAQLQVFLTVARLKSFGGAARELALSRSTVSHAVQQLEKQLDVILLVRTTRSVALTDAGRQLVEQAGPGLTQAANALTNVSTGSGQRRGCLRLSVPRVAVPLVMAPLLPTFRARHPSIDVELVLEERLVDIVAGGFDAGVRLSEHVDRDMLQVRLTGPFRFVVVGTPAYLTRYGTPECPADLAKHECITFRSPTNGAPYAWELERGRKQWRAPVHGGVLTNDGLMCAFLARLGLGLAYAPEPSVEQELRTGELRRVLEEYAPTVPGFFLYYPRHGQRTEALRLFVEVAKELSESKCG